MSRLTKKFNGEYYHKEAKTIMFDSEVEYNAIQKLGKLEDLEEELGCPLEALIKSLLEGGIIEDDGYGAQLTGLAINGDGSLSLIAINGDHYDLKDYGKTWWLEGEKDD
jgi:hypothetical protein